MGNGASVSGPVNHTGGSGRTSVWSNIRTKLSLHSVSRTIPERYAQGVWQQPRREREPWKTLLANAANNLQEELKGKPSNNRRFLQEFQALLEGNIPVEPPSNNTKEVWVFISSTFTDTKVERNLLMEDVYPFLREYCRLIGCNFNEVDLRWGVRDEATDEHQTVKICLQEILRCRETSIGPFFVGILSHKYGWRPFPPEIPWMTFNKLTEQIQQSNEFAAHLLKKWFALDRNALDPVYLLQPISTHYPGYVTGSKTDGKSWTQEYGAMQVAMRGAARLAGLDEDDIDKYHNSVTEGEILKALDLGESDGRLQERCFFFSRTIDGFNTSDQNARFYTDVCSEGNVDNESLQKLTTLKERVKEKMGDRAMLSYHMTWEPGAGLTAGNNVRNAQLFCDEFCRQLISSIVKGVVKGHSAENPLYDELVHHAEMCRQRLQTFVGREDYLSKMLEYLAKASPGTPMIVHGMGGSGKTSLLSKAFSLSLEKNDGMGVGRPTHVIRFTGTSPASSNAKKLLQSICSQLSLCYNSRKPLPHDYRGLSARFLELLYKATEQKPLVLFIDSLDQLEGGDEGDDLTWLPTALPPNVHLVLSTLTRGETLGILKSMGFGDDSFLQVLPLDAAQSKDMVTSRLEKQGRTLTPGQQEKLLTSHQKGQLTPLYVRIASDMAAKWKSYTPLERCDLAPSTTALIKQFFRQLEKTHGKILVSHTLSYITASKSGLSTNELLDVLSCDESVLDDVFQYHMPPVRRLPTLLWTRLRNDLGDYLVENGVEGTVVYRWYHRLFAEVAREMYLSHMADLIHRDLADYFMGRWAHEPKPFLSKDDRLLHLKGRGVYPQDLVLSDGKGDGSETIYNQRKLTELPHHIISAKMWTTAESVMCSIPWMEAKCRTGRVYELTSELSQAAKECPEVSDCHRFILANVRILHENPDVLCQQALNEHKSSSVVTAARKHLKGTKVVYWIDRTKDQSPRPELLVLKHPGAVRLCLFSPDNTYLAVASDGGSLNVWKVAVGAPVFIVKAAPVAMAFHRQNLWLAVCEAKNIKIFGLGIGGNAEGTVLQNIKLGLQCDYCTVLYVPQTNKELRLVTFGQFLVFNVQTGEQSQKKNFRCRPKAAAFSPTTTSLAVVGNEVFLWDYNTDTDLKTLHTDKNLGDSKQAHIAFSRDGRRVAAVLAIGTYLWNVPGPSSEPFRKLLTNSLSGWAAFSPHLDFLAMPERNDLSVFSFKANASGWSKLKGHTEAVTCCSFGSARPQESPPICSGGNDNTVRVWDSSLLTSAPSQNHKAMVCHQTSVTSCGFSTLGDSVISCSADTTYLWDLLSGEPVLNATLRTPQACKEHKVACFSLDDDFACCYCYLGVDVWYLRGSHQGSDTRMGVHRTIPFLNMSHLFVTFGESGLKVCFTTEAKPGVVVFYPILSSDELEDWRSGSSEPGPDTQTLSTTEFDHGENVKITAAAVNRRGDTLGTMQVALDSYNSSRKTNSTFVLTSPVVVLWKVRSQEISQRIELPNGLTAHHNILFSGSKTVIYMLERRQTKKACSTPSKDDMFAVIRMQGNQPSELELQYRDTGYYTTMLEVTDMTGVLKGGHRLAGWHLAELDSHGVFHSLELGGNKMAFAMTSTHVTSFGLSGDRKAAVMGCDNGQVHLLRKQVF
ncbi:telomerase protein component 1-like [Branchiostoma floridae x Branchiostoma japonicum]